MCVRLFVWCTLRRVMYEYFFFLNDIAVLLLLFLKKVLLLHGSSALFPSPS